MDELVQRTLQQAESDVIIRVLGKLEHQLQSISSSQQTLDPLVASRVLQITLPRLLFTKDVEPEDASSDTLSGRLWSLSRMIVRCGSALCLRHAVTPAYLHQALRAGSVHPNWLVELLSFVLIELSTHHQDACRELCCVLGDGCVVLTTRCHAGALGSRPVERLCLLLSEWPAALPSSAEVGRDLVLHLLSRLASARLSDFDGPQRLVEWAEALAGTVQQIWARQEDSVSLMEPTLRALFVFLSDKVHDSTSSESEMQQLREEPLALAAVLRHIQLHLVPLCVEHLLQMLAHQEAPLRRLLRRLTLCLRWPLARNLDVWLLMLIQGLARVKRTVLVLEYIMETAVYLPNLLTYSSARCAATTLLEFMLLVTQHTSLLLDNVAPLLPPVLAHLAGTATSDRASARVCETRLAEALHITVSHHRRRAAVFHLPSEVEAFLSRHPPPNTELAKQRLKAHRWSSIVSMAAFSAASNDESKLRIGRRRGGVSLDSRPDFSSSSLVASRLKTRSETDFVGLINLGNTCYVNACVQLLWSCPEAHEALKEIADSTSHCEVQVALRNLFGSLADRSAAVADAGPFLALSRPAHMTAGVQQDAQEYLLHLLEQLGAEGGCGANIASLFTGRLEHELQCGACGHLSVSGAEVRELFVSLPAQVETQHEDSSSCSSVLAITDLADLVRAQFCESERLMGENAPMCEPCGGVRQEHLRRARLATAPRCLLLVLARFTYCRVARAAVKLLRRIRVPSELRVETGLELKPLLYQLQGAVIHHGAALAYGHYTCLACPSVASSWILFDDDSVTFAYDTADQLLHKGSGPRTDTPYILLYRLATHNPDVDQMTSC